MLLHVVKSYLFTIALFTPCTCLGDASDNLYVQIHENIQYTRLDDIIQLQFCCNIYWTVYFVNCLPWCVILKNVLVNKPLPSLKLSSEAATRGVLWKKLFWKNLSLFPGKRMCWSLFLIKFQVLSSATLLKKRLQHVCFLVSIAKFLRTHILKISAKSCSCFINCAAYTIIYT